MVFLQKSLFLFNTQFFFKDLAPVQLFNGCPGWIYSSIVSLFDNHNKFNFQFVHNILFFKFPQHKTLARLQPIKAT